MPVGFSTQILSTTIYTTISPGYVYANDWSGELLQINILGADSTEAFHITTKNSASALFVRKGVKLKTNTTVNSSQQALFLYNNNE